MRHFLRLEPGALGAPCGSVRGGAEAWISRISLLGPKAIFPTDVLGKSRELFERQALYKYSNDNRLLDPKVKPLAWKDSSKCSWNRLFVSAVLETGVRFRKPCSYRNWFRTYLPAVGGLTIYTFGDARKLRDEKTEVTVRVHDECIGSDVFGSDICSCRPYLIFALQQAVECAQRGGVGIVIYYRKDFRGV